MLSTSAVLVAASFTALVRAQQQSDFGQCGGENYTGPTTCPTGWHCQPHNDFYSQCTTGDGGAIGTRSTCIAATVTAFNTITSTMQPAPTSVEADAVVVESELSSSISSSSVASSTTLVMYQADISANHRHGRHDGDSTTRSSTVSTASSSSSATISADASSSTSKSSTQTSTSTLSSSSAISDYAQSSASAYSSQSSAKSPSTTLTGTGPTYSASFTGYGLNDGWGSPVCVNNGACGYRVCNGYSIAVSEALYETGICGTCWRLTVQVGSDKKVHDIAGNSIVAKVTNRCPRKGNEICSMETLDDVNEMNATVNFDTCMDSGATTALFGEGNGIMGAGTVEEVDCSLWDGTYEKYKNNDVPPGL